MQSKVEDKKGVYRKEQSWLRNVRKLRKRIQKRSFQPSIIRVHQKKKQKSLLDRLTLPLCQVNSNQKLHLFLIPTFQSEELFFYEGSYFQSFSICFYQLLRSILKKSFYYLHYIFRHSAKFSISFRAEAHRVLANPNYNSDMK